MLRADDPGRASARERARAAQTRGEPKAWFEELYRDAGRSAEDIPWADLVANPSLLGWIDQGSAPSPPGRAVVVGCGLGDDAEELARRGFEVTAFDVAPTAIGWCRDRFPESPVDYRVADLFALPGAWRSSFDLVFEAYTLQVLPRAIRGEALAAIGALLRPGGQALVVCRGRDEDSSEGDLPWPLTRSELSALEARGHELVSFEDFYDQERPPVRRFRACYRCPRE
jgi:SAM-dependent methyltransferase